MAMDRRSAPIMILSLASSKWRCSTALWFSRAANSAASLTRLAKSAPEKPGVPRAISRASTPSARRTLFMCTFKISSRPFRSGSGTTTWRSNRPGRNSAWSSTSGRLVAAIMMMPSLPSKPSISTSSWLRVCSRSSCPPPRPAPRWRPTASSSSIKMMQGACLRAVSNMSRTREAPTPTNISTKSDPEMEKNGTLASPAMARAKSVLPVPGGPTSRTPLGMRPPGGGNLPGRRKNSPDPNTPSSAPPHPAHPSKLALAGQGAPPKGRARAGGADRKDRLGKGAPQALERARIAQKLHQLKHFVLGLIAAGHIIKGDLDLIFALQLGARLAKAHGAAAPAATALHLAHEINPQADQHQHRQQADQNINQNGPLFGRPGLDFDVVVEQILDQAVVAWGHDAKLLAIAGQAHDDLAAAAFLNFNAAYVAVLNLVQKVRVVHVALLNFRLRVVIEYTHQHNGDDDPHHQVFGKITQN